MNGSLVQENVVKISSIREWIIYDSITKKCGIRWIFEENENGKQISDSKEIENKVDQTNWRMDD